VPLAKSNRAPKRRREICRNDCDRGNVAALDEDPVGACKSTGRGGVWQGCVFSHPFCLLAAEVFSLSDHCPIRFSQGSETVFRRRLCRSLSISYGFNPHCHGRGRQFRLIVAHFMRGLSSESSVEIKNSTRQREFLKPKCSVGTNPGTGVYVPNCGPLSLDPISGAHRPGS
jgi:hypothetical protein